MISVNGVTKTYGGRTLFNDVNVKFTPGNRYGLTGPNGAGKSTFMKILTGDIEPSNRGTISKPRKVGVLRQNQNEFNENRIIDTVMMGNPALWSAMNERNQLCLLSDFTEAQMNRLGELESTVADENGYMAELEAADILRGIGIPDTQHYDLMETLPNDEKFRVLLAQAVFGDPEALLLDEPTNYMDLESVSWLEGFLQDYKGTLIVISHDRHFLNAVCTHIADIDYETIILYPGNYDDMVEQKMSVRRTIEQDNKDKEKKVDQLQEFVSKFGAGQRSSQVQSRRKEMARLAPTELKKSNIQRPYVRFETKRQTGRDVVIAKGLTKAFGKKVLFQNFDFAVQRGDKVAIIGANGVGKTTLLRCLINEVEQDTGTIKWGSDLNFGYYPQNAEESILHGMTALEWLSRFDEDGDPQIVRGLLGRMLFSGDESLKSTEKLSGGETARLLTARLMLEKKPILVFDEPTNHLDLESVNALGDGLSQFEGTVLIVTHDRDLISDVATRILSFTPEGLIDFPGTYEEYLEKYPLPTYYVKTTW
ncbi:MAG: ATP-binding cassette domain-containing protein [Chthonomonadaceae bacterium]|nr:ATP-binding cassette domain-containing protein [Chthonomonadaceae bacterium]